MSRKTGLLKRKIRQAVVTVDPKDHKNHFSQKISTAEGANIIRPKKAGEKFNRRVSRAIEQLKNDRLS